LDTTSYMGRNLFVHRSMTFAQKDTHFAKQRVGLHSS